VAAIHALRRRYCDADLSPNSSFPKMESENPIFSPGSDVPTASLAAYIFSGFRCPSGQLQIVAMRLSDIQTATTSVLSPKYEVFCRRSAGCFSRRSEPDWRRSARIFVIRVERATRQNSPLAPAQRVAMKMGRRLRCSSVTYRFRYAPSSASPARTALPAAHLIATKYLVFRGQDTSFSQQTDRPADSFFCA
jgi:hypothetical protein